MGDIVASDESPPNSLAPDFAWQGEQPLVWTDLPENFQATEAPCR